MSFTSSELIWFSAIPQLKTGAYPVCRSARACRNSTTAHWHTVGSSPNRTGVRRGPDAAVRQPARRLVGLTISNSIFHVRRRLMLNRNSGRTGVRVPFRYNGGACDQIEYLAIDRLRFYDRIDEGPLKVPAVAKT